MTARNRPLDVMKIGALVGAAIAGVAFGVLVVIVLGHFIIKFW